MYFYTFYFMHFLYFFFCAYCTMSEVEGGQRPPACPRYYWWLFMHSPTIPIKHFLHTFLLYTFNCIHTFILYTYFHMKNTHSVFVSALIVRQFVFLCALICWYGWMLCCRSWILEYMKYNLNIGEWPCSWTEKSMKKNKKESKSIQRDIRTGWNIDSSNTRFGCFHFYGFVHFQYSLNYDRSGGGAVILALIGFGWIERVLPHRLQSYIGSS